MVMFGQVAGLTPLPGFNLSKGKGVKRKLYSVVIIVVTIEVFLTY